MVRCDAKFGWWDSAKGAEVAMGCGMDDVVNVVG
jgi:hypothetical protein